LSGLRQVFIIFIPTSHRLNYSSMKSEWLPRIMGEASGRGIGKRILTTLLDVGREVGCTQAWVLTERENAPAVRLYKAAGSEEELATSVMFSFSLI
jgi:GNAT superfamily N-acetyltransferase